MNRVKNKVATQSQRVLANCLVLTFTVIFTSCHHVVDPVPSAADTTSHNFVWQTEAIGDGPSSLYDVAVINDSLAYAVGMIYMRDSSGSIHFPAYNLARWNGKTWEALLLDPIYAYTPCYSIVAFGPDDIWVGGSSPAHWNGKSWFFYGWQGEYPGRFQIGAIGGTGSNDLYCAGAGGELVHFDGKSWQKVASGTTANLGDVWGGSNPLVGTGMVLLPAADKFAYGDRKLLRASQGIMRDTIQWTRRDGRPISSAWFSSESPVYVCGTGVYSYDGTQWTEFTNLPLVYTEKIRGNSPNDIMVVGDFGVVAHFNGSSWKDYPQLALTNGQYRSVSMKGKIVIAVGSLYDTQTAAILIGRRQ